LSEPFRYESVSSFVSVVVQLFFISEIVLSHKHAIRGVFADLVSIILFDVDSKTLGHCIFLVFKQENHFT
jgi:hypothetical protein